MGPRYVSFPPTVEPMPDGTVGPHTVAADAYGAFLCAVFDEWVRQDVGRIAVQIFEEATRPARPPPRPPGPPPRARGEPQRPVSMRQRPQVQKVLSRSMRRADWYGG